MFRITHTIRGGFCTTCGDTEEWLRSTGEIVMDAPETEPEIEEAAEELPTLTRRQREILGDYHTNGGPRRRTNQTTVDTLKVAGLLGYDGDETNTRTSGKSFGITPRGLRVLAGAR